MQMLCGTVTTKPCLAVGPLSNEDRIFMVPPSASAVDVAYTGDNVFQVCFTDPMQGTVSAEVIAEKGLGSKVGVIYDSSDVYSTGILETFVEEAEQEGLDVVCTEAFTGDTKADLSTQVTKCKEAGADLVFLPIYYTEASSRRPRPWVMPPPSSVWTAWTAFWTWKALIPLWPTACIC